VRPSVTTFAVPVEEIMTRLRADFAIQIESQTAPFKAPLNMAEQKARAKFEEPSG